MIPYFICLLIGGIPAYFMEVALGQYWQNGGITAWSLVCPLFKGSSYHLALVTCYNILFFFRSRLWNNYYMLCVKYLLHCNIELGLTLSVLFLQLDFALVYLR